MDTFVYNPSEFKPWAQNVVNYLNGGSESVSGIAKRFSAEMDKLVEPGTWTGPAAYQNFQNFKDTHNALVNFINSFGDNYAQAMRELNSRVQDLETSNLGNAGVVNVDVPNYDNIQNLADQNINQEIVTYNYGTISSISGALQNIKSDLDSLKENLSRELDKVGSTSQIWGGQLAENTKNTLKDNLQSNYSKASDSLNICINNIKEAAENAQNADR